MLAEKVRAANTAVAAYSDGYSLADTDEAELALNTLWAESASFICHAAQASAHRTPSPEHIKLLSPLEPQILQLGETAYAVALNRDGLGTVYVVETHPEPARVIWNLAALDAAAVAEAPELSAWQPHRARFHCRDGESAGEWMKCGPLVGRVGLLPAAGDGAPRFFVAGTYSQPAGMTGTAQLSLWVVRGGRVEPLRVIHYPAFFDDESSVRVEGDFVTVRMKEEFNSYYTCGACPGRMALWKFRLGKDVVEDLGRESVVPELDIVDTFLSRAAHGESVKSLASSAAERALRPILRRARREAPTGTKAVFGMLNSSSVVRVGNRRRVCIDTDNGGIIYFLLSPTLSSWKVSEVSRGPDDGCRADSQP